MANDKLKCLHQLKTLHKLVYDHSAEVTLRYYILIAEFVHLSTKLDRTKLAHDSFH